MKHEHEPGYQGNIKEPIWHGIKVNMVAHKIYQGDPWEEVSALYRVQDGNDLEPISNVEVSNLYTVI